MSPPKMRVYGSVIELGNVVVVVMVVVVVVVVVLVVLVDRLGY